MQGRETISGNQPTVMGRLEIELGKIDHSNPNAIEILKLKGFRHIHQCASFYFAISVVCGMKNAFKEFIGAPTATIVSTEDNVTAIGAIQGNKTLLDGIVFLLDPKNTSGLNLRQRLNQLTSPQQAFWGEQCINVFTMAKLAQFFDSFNKRLDIIKDQHIPVALLVTFPGDFNAVCSFDPQTQKWSYFDPIKQPALVENIELETLLRTIHSKISSVLQPEILPIQNNVIRDTSYPNGKFALGLKMLVNKNDSDKVAHLSSIIKQFDIQQNDIAALRDPDLLKQLYTCSTANMISSNYISSHIMSNQHFAQSHRNVQSRSTLKTLFLSCFSCCFKEQKDVNPMRPPNY